MGLVLAVRHLRFNEVDLAELIRALSTSFRSRMGLGIALMKSDQELRWAVSRLLLHLGTSDITTITDEHLAQRLMPVTVLASVQMWASSSNRQTTINTTSVINIRGISMCCMWCCITEDRSRLLRNGLPAPGPHGQQ